MSSVETLRSTQLSLDILGGTRLFLRYDATKRYPYSVETRWQVLKRVATLPKASAAFDAIVNGEMQP